ncbi:enoyl-CoA hydratase [Polymorphobacter multimanifer]|nr:enoyl-CoA hydratase [Polymorphobacter multimanifer]
MRAIVLSGEGKSFCAGADVNWMRRAADFTPEQNQQDALKLSDMLATINACPKPVIARVHGAVSGGGGGLVACADMVVAEEGTTFRLSEVRLGLTPATISPFVIAKIGASHARRLFLTAEPFGPEMAQRIGLSHETAIDRDAAQAQITVWLSHLQAAAPGAVADAKALVATISGERITDTLRTETPTRAAARRPSPEAPGGLRAFLEKRAPAWNRLD